MKRTKKITSAIKIIAEGLPKQKYHYFTNQTESGADLIQRGVKFDGDELPILPHKDYVKKIANPNEVNHVNRLKSAYDANGFDGLKKYLDPFVKPDLKDEFFANVCKLIS